MHRELVAAAALCTALCTALATWAQSAPDFLPGTMGRPTVDPEWKEVEAPPPPALRTMDLVTVDVSGAGELRYGVDPQSVEVGKDRVVRYVLVASSRSGAVNGIYEGVNCERGEFRVFARSTGQGWRETPSEWKSLFEGGEARHALAVAKAGACRGRTPNGDAAQVVRDLRTPLARKFGGSSAP